jgi:hypothetical protein
MKSSQWPPIFFFCPNSCFWAFSIG